MLSFALPLSLMLSVVPDGVDARATAIQASQSGELYVLDAEARLPSSDTSWDYMKLEAGTPNLYVARRKDGLTLFDAQQMRFVHRLANSEGANGPVLLPKLGRGYVAMTDGSLLTIDLKTRQTLARTPLATDGGLNSGVMEPRSGKLFMIVGGRSKETTWFTLAPETGNLLSTKVFPFRKMDDPAYDSDGYLYAPARHDNLILKLRADDLSEVSRFSLNACVQPSKVAFHRPANRLLVACRGDKPVLQILDPADGRLIASLPIAAGVDGLAVDDKRGRIVTSGDNALSVIRHVGDDAFEKLGDVATRPGAKIMAMDKTTGNVFVVAAGRTDTPASAGEAGKTLYHPNSFTVMRYAPR